MVQGNRRPFGRATAPKATGRTTVAKTPLAIRTSGMRIDDETRLRVRSRLGAKLGKFAERITRVVVRFIDENGPRGGIDTVCRVKVVISGLDDFVVFESRASDAAEAAALAAVGVERAVRRTLDRAAGGRRTSTLGARPETTPSVPRASGERTRRGGQAPSAGSLIGRRVGGGEKNLQSALDRPEKRRRDQPIDTAQPGVSATDRRAGGASTAARNTKHTTNAQTSALEDSIKDRPSRKSTRKSANRSKRDSNLQRRQVRRVTAPKARAARSIAKAGTPST
jgi:hypothetical protein